MAIMATNIDEALCEARRNKLEAEFEKQIDREIFAIARSRSYQPHRPNKPRNFTTYREASAKGPVVKYGR